MPRSWIASVTGFFLSRKDAQNFLPTDVLCQSSAQRQLRCLCACSPRSDAGCCRMLTGSSAQRSTARNDPWTQRLRDKYGLDAAAFRTDPNAPSASQLAMEEQAERSRRPRSSCGIQ